MKTFFIIQAVLLALLLLAVFLYIENNYIDVTKYKLRSASVNSRFKIAHLSDLHSKPFYEVIDKLKEQHPDLIVITGDYINDHEKNKEKMLSFGKALLALAPVYYITGNHERRLASFDTLMEELRNIGFHVLLNETAQLTIEDNEIAILGLDENQANFDDYKARKADTFVYQDMAPYFQELEVMNGFKLVLSHYPENFAAVKENNYSQYGFDLQLSGHAHGGQFNLPFIGPVFSPGQGLRPQYAKGSFGKKPMLIVSRGIGNAEFPFRLFNHPEINIITVTRELEK
ncbi:MAG: metallophosphoesterase [Eubacterium sp.]|nr:metallophosphoesterase [Eubacterium sp.]